MLITLFFAFLKIGFLGFGGGYAMLSLIFQEGQKFGLTIQQFADLNAIDVLIPGPIAVNSATYVGQLFGGFPGAFVTTLAVSIPSLIFVPLYMRYEEKIQGNKWMNQFLSGVKNASVGLIFAVGLTIVLETVFDVSSIMELAQIHIEWFSLSIFAIALFTHLKWQVNPIIITLGAGIAGYLVYYLV